MTYWDPNIKPDAISVGDYAIKRAVKLDREYKSDNKALQRLLDDVRNAAERMINGIPDYDSGFQFVEMASSYNVNHNLGTVPSRVSMHFCSTTGSPRIGKDNVYLVVPDRGDYNTNLSGISIRFNDKNTLTVITGTDKSFLGNDEGYLRVMLWR